MPGGRIRGLLERFPLIRQEDQQVDVDSQEGSDVVVGLEQWVDTVAPPRVRQHQAGRTVATLTAVPAPTRTRR